MLLSVVTVVAGKANKNRKRVMAKERRKQGRENAVPEETGNGTSSILQRFRFSLRNVTALFNELQTYLG
jgi:hypothetical protein